MDSNLELVKFASLLHDIGKFYQRMDNQGSAPKNYDSRFDKLSKDDYGDNGAHSKWSADFVSKFYNDDVEDLVLYHHNPSKSFNKDLCKIIQKADHHSSTERNTSETTQKVLDTPLISIFSKINDSDEYYIPLKELNIDESVYPKEFKDMSGWNLQPDYIELWNKFIKEFECINPNDFDTVLALMKKYTSTIPSAVYKSVSDISLYDHAKTTSALATCRYLFSLEDKLNSTNEQDVYLAINGDISGIQKFIYKISTPEDAQSHMSKRLRGRSLYLTLLSEAVTSKIIDDLNLNQSNIIFCGGGRFTIIAPNTDKVKQSLDSIKKDLNNFFIDKFNAELYLSIVSKEISGDDLADFGKVIEELNICITHDKKHKFVDDLEKVFEIEDKVDYDKLCPVCGNKLENDIADVCLDCQNHENLGTKAANANYIIKYASDYELDDSGFFVDFLKCGYIFKKTNKEVLDVINNNNDIKLTVYKLNDTNFLKLANEVHSDNVSFDFKFLGNNVPNIKGKPLYFQHLAKISKGADKLGILKMDVDNLGTIFSDGFNYLEKGASISKISSLSFYMDVFFSGVINNIIKKYKVYTSPEGLNDYEREIKLDFDGETKVVYKADSDSDENSTFTIYINYSGGDDLLVLGPYDDIINFAYDFRTEFKKWTAYNPSVNISAGITIVGAKFPIGKAADMAEGFLESSKNCGRNRITLFDEVLTWDSNGLEKGFDEVFSFANKLEGYTRNNKISKGLVYSLLRIWKLKFRNSKEGLSSEDAWNDDIHNRLSSKEFVPLFKYKLRLIKDNNVRNDIDKNGIKLMPWIKTPVSWVSLRLR